MADQTVNLVALTRDQWDLYLAGYRSGYLCGLDVGRQHERDEVAALGREAARIVHALADVPERDVEADAEQAAKRAAWWAARRGEVA